MTIRNLSGWRPSLPDARDHFFTAKPEVALTLPQRIDCSTPALPTPFTPTWDQSTIGSCGPQSAAGDVVFDMLSKHVGAAVPMPSRLQIYYATRMLMGTVNQDSGVDNRSLMKALNQYGWCDESLWPYDVSRIYERPPQACWEQAATRKVTQYLAVPQTLQDMKACLAGGDPFIFGFTVYDSFMSDATARTGDAPMPNLMRERVLGGHDVLMVGYDDATQRFKFRNSWGEWGKNGFGTLPYAFCTNPRYASDFWTVRGSGWTPPTPVPPPPPEPPTPPRPTRYSVVLQSDSPITLAP